MNKITLLSLCLLGSSSLQAMHEQYHAHMVDNTMFRNKEIHAVTFTSNKDLTFIGTPFAEFNKLKYLAFTAKNQRIVTKNGIKYAETLNPYEDLGAPINCKIVSSSEINELAPNQNSSYMIPERRIPNSLQNVQIEPEKSSCKKKKKVEQTTLPKVNAVKVTDGQMVNDILDKVRPQLLQDFESHIHGERISLKPVCDNIIENRDALLKYSKDMPQNDIVNYKFQKLRQIVTPSGPAVLLQYIDLGECRLSFSLAPRFSDIIVLDNKLPIEDDNCRIRFIQSNTNDVLHHQEQIESQVLDDPTDQKVRFLAYSRHNFIK